ncbi:hypothetical protein L3X38_016155 [Prunus dulcis]|uniref:Protein kinase domain-containing protein n=1 Tax=Prunus dulcis TaxID=3755 RepID=A0AAD4W7A6_PRUDU|nr:hypothetical protein L3X38_016155 [Prunus dulcis]
MKDLNGLDMLHNDALIICIHIEQAMIEQVHVDEGSAIKILQLFEIQQIGLEPKINKLARSLTDFNDATSITMETINLDIHSPLDQGVLTQRHPQASNHFPGSLSGGFPHLDPGSLIAIRRNLISLVGYFKDGTNTGRIYEYMDNRNLRKHLSDNSSNILSWAGRLRIAMDTAHGFEYLHYCCKPPIIHRNEKSTNILLNENFQAKLSDFGLSRIFSAEDGTHEYLDPEHRLDLSYMVEIGDIKSIVDPWLIGNFNSNSVWKTVEIALICVSSSSNRRPTMSQVVMELKECLAIELARKNHHTESEDSIEMRPVKFTTEMRPLAR